jgi:hypothetical protein
LINIFETVEVDVQQKKSYITNPFDVVWLLLMLLLNAQLVCLACCTRLGPFWMHFRGNDGHVPGWSASVAGVPNILSDNNLEMLIYGTFSRI